MKITFAKLFEFEDHQVLILKSDNDDSFSVIQITDLNTVRPEMSVSFDTEEKRDKFFDKYGREEAEKFYAAVFSLCNEN